MNKILEDAKRSAEEKINKINNKIMLAREEREELEAQLNIDDSMEKYTSLCIKINSYKEYENKLKEEQLKIKNNIFSNDIMEKAKTNIQKEYNKKLKKVYDDLIISINKVLEAYNNYNLEYESFLNEREHFNSCSSGYSLYEGENAIQYKDVKNYKQAMEHLNREVKKENQ